MHGRANGIWSVGKLDGDKEAFVGDTCETGKCTGPRNRPQIFELIPRHRITANEEKKGKVRPRQDSGDETNQRLKAKCSPLIEEANSNRTQFNQAIGTKGRL